MALTAHLKWNIRILEKYDFQYPWVYTLNKHFAMSIMTTIHKSSNGICFSIDNNNKLSILEKWRTEIRKKKEEEMEEKE